MFRRISKANSNLSSKEASDTSVTRNAKNDSNIDNRIPKKEATLSIQTEPPTYTTLESLAAGSKNIQEGKISANWPNYGHFLNSPYRTS